MAILQAFDLSGKTAVVTGANSGIGFAIAAALAEAGAHVIALTRSNCDALQTQILEQGGRFTWIACELSSVAALQAGMQQAQAISSQLDILVNNAGMIQRNAALEFTETEWDSVLDLNLKSAFFLAQSFARVVLAAPRNQQAKIINIASMLSFQGGLRVASYTASKSGLLGLTRLLANEWAARGINVNALAPGYIETQNTQALRADAARNADILARIPAGRWGKPTDLAGAAVFLASSASDYVHGSVVAVDGGWLAR